MERSGGRRRRRSTPPRYPARASPEPRVATTPRPASASRRRGRRLRVQSPSLAAARREAAPPPPPPPPETPPVRWPLAACDAGAPSSRAGAAPSVRKIAAALWRMQPPQAPLPESGRPRRRIEPSSKRPHTPDHCQYYKAVIQGRIGNKPVNNRLREVEAHSAAPQIETEVATKWDHQLMRASRGANYDCFEHNLVDAGGEIYSLKEELMQAQNRIHELEAECQSTKKQLDHLVKNLAEEKASWESREYDKVRNILDAVKEELNRERKNRQQAEMVNSELLSELSELKSVAKRYLHDYEKERKARELMEEVCDELAKEIAEDKAEVETLRSESIKIRDELEEEKKMLQMAEVWREERVQMKLVDAKLTLEYNYSQLSKLQAELEAFLSSQPGYNLGKETVREAERLREAICSVKVNDTKEFSYKPPPSGDIFAVFEELKQREDTNEKEIVQCNGYRPINRASKIDTVSPETDILENPASKYSNQPCTKNKEPEDDSGWETVSQVEENVSSNSPGGSEPSVNGFRGENDVSASGTDWDDNCENGKAHSEISEVCLATTGKYRKKGSFVRLWRSSNGDDHKQMGAEILTGRMSNVAESPDLKNGEVCNSSPSVGQWRPDLLNPQIVRAIKGCIEWPRGMQKHSLKSKLLEARINGSKVQLRQALKQKI